MKMLQYMLWGLVAIVGGAAGGYFYIHGTEPAGAVKVAGAPSIGGPFELVDHSGARLTQDALPGSPSILFFGFTHCPEICPTTLSDISGWLDSLGDEGRGIKSYFITVDPERDTPEVMKDYVTTFSSRITGLTGSPEEIAGILRNYRVFARKVQLGNGDYTMDHTASVILLDKKGEFVSTISYGEAPAAALDKLRLLIRRG